MVPANQDPQNEGVYYSTLYHNTQRYTLPDGTEAFVATISGDALILTKIAEGGQVIPEDNAVILKSNAQTIHMEQTDADPVTFSVTNDLRGSNSTVTNSGHMYVLSGADGVVGFYKLASGTDVPAYKAYITLGSGIAGAPKKLRFVFNQATGVESIQNSAISIQKVIRNGQVVILRNGVEFNVNGQKLK